VGDKWRVTGGGKKGEAGRGKKGIRDLKTTTEEGGEGGGIQKEETERTQHH